VDQIALTSGWGLDSWLGGVLWLVDMN